jgi:peptidoglycan/xylan/chitin deacetylase (PgdA/CDA1 family)
MSSRREFLKQGSLIGLAGIRNPKEMFSFTPKKMQIPENTAWADGSRLVVSVSMQFEAGGQTDNAESPFPQNMQKGFIDWPSETWYQYGYKEGVPRMLDNWDKLGIKITSHMVGSAVLKNPALAKEIVQRGHEAAAHGMNWSTQYTMPYEEERKFIKDGVDAIKHVTGFDAVGYKPIG